MTPHDADHVAALVAALVAAALRRAALILRVRGLRPTGEPRQPRSRAVTLSTAVVLACDQLTEPRPTERRASCGISWADLVVAVGRHVEDSTGHGLTALTHPDDNCPSRAEAVARRLDVLADHADTLAARADPTP